MAKERCSHCFSTIGPFNRHPSGVRLCSENQRECYKRGADRIKAAKAKKAEPVTHDEMVMAWTGCKKEEVPHIDAVILSNWGPGLSNFTKAQYRSYARQAYAALKIKPDLCKHAR